MVIAVLPRGAFCSPVQGALIGAWLLGSAAMGSMGWQVSGRFVVQDDCSGLPHYKKCNQSMHEIKKLLEDAKRTV